MEPSHSTSLFFARIGEALGQVSEAYDVVIIDCPRNSVSHSLVALCRYCRADHCAFADARRYVDVEVLNMTGSLLTSSSERAGQASTTGCGILSLATSRVTDRRRRWLVSCARSSVTGVNASHRQSTAISDAGLTKQTLYEVERQQFTRDIRRAIEALDLVDGEIEG